METILFDLDDTLIESMHVWEDAIIHLFKKMNLYMSMEEARQIFFTMKFSVFVRNVPKGATVLTWINL